MGEATGLGVMFLYEDDAEEGEFIDVGYVVTVTPPQLTRDTIDVDALNPAGELKRKLVGLIDGGEFTITVNFVPGDVDQAALQSHFEDGEERNYRIQFPFDDTVYAGGGYLSLTGRVTGYALQEISSGAVMQAEITFVPTELPEYEELTELED